MFVFAGAWFHMDHHVRRDNLADALFHRLARGVRFLKAGGAGDADGRIDKITLARPAHAHTFSAQDAFGFVQSGGDTLAQAAGSNVEERVSGAFAQARADPDDYSGDAQRGNRVQFAQPRNAIFLPEQCAGDADDDYEGAPNVGGKVQRVGFQRFAGIFLGHAIQGARTDEIYAHGYGENQNGRDARVNFDGMEDEALDGLEYDVNRGEK